MRYVKDLTDQELEEELENAKSITQRVIERDIRQRELIIEQMERLKQNQKDK
mgnify:CR=1 FL=1